MVLKGYVYILADKSNSMIVIDTTTNLKRKLEKYRQFTKHFKLIYYEAFEKRYQAIRRKRALAGMAKKEKIQFITIHNPKWEDRTKALG